MRVSFILYNLILSVSALVALPGKTHCDKFITFVEIYNKTYSPSEYATRYNAFKLNLEKIDAHNTNTSNTWKMSINRFADISHEEFSQHRKKWYSGSISRKLRGQDSNYVKEIDKKDFPNTVDWVAKGAVTEVKNQGQCGSCWAFSSTGGIEGAYFLSTGQLKSFSEQQLVDCSSSWGNNGCGGGLMDNAFKFLISGKGICLESDYPYVATSTGTCRQCTPATIIQRYVDVQPYNETALQEAVIGRPVSVAVDADPFQLYSSGILSGECGTTLDHGVLLVGYGTKDGKDYWKIKNSWGSEWGEEGYILLERNVHAKEGLCGVTLLASYPII